MGKIGGHKSFKPESPIARNIVKFLAVNSVFLVIFLVVFYIGPIYQYSWAPKQPIDFSHKLHAGDKKINCQYCHSYARRSEMAGVPAVKTCMNCHSRMKEESMTPKIKQVIQHFENKEPIPWVRIYDLPDHVWFSHKRHIAKDVPCQKCHGPVETLEVNKLMVHYRMKFCLDCHQEKEAPTDCLTCHT